MGVLRGKTKPLPALIISTQRDRAALPVRMMRAHRIVFHLPATLLRDGSAANFDEGHIKGFITTQPIRLKSNKFC